MVGILQGQGDYLAFLAGLVFFLLFLVCLAICRGWQPRAPFFWLGLFGLSQWGWHWFLMLCQVRGGVVYQDFGKIPFLVIALILIGMMGLSSFPAGCSRGTTAGLFFFLLASALLAGWTGHYDVFGPLIVLTALGCSLLAGRALFLEGRRGHSDLTALAALALAAYGLTIPLVLPPQHLGLGPGVPWSLPGSVWAFLPMLQASLAVVIILCIWLFYQKQNSSGSSHSSFGQLRHAGYFVLALSLLLIMGGFSTALLGRSLEADMRAELALQARLLGAALPGESIRQLTASRADLETEDYKKIKQLLMALRAAHEDCHFMYLIGYRQDDVVFLADSEPPNSQDYSPPGQIYHEASEKLKSMANAPQAFLEGPETDRWGTWMSALEVIRDPVTGKFLAFVGVDIDIQDWQRKIAWHKLFPIGITLLMVLLLSGGHLALQKLLSSAHQVAQSEERYRSLVEGTPNGVCLFDGEGHFLAVNGNGLAMLGVAEGEIIGRHFQEFWSLEQRPQVSAAFQQVKEGRLATFEGKISPFQGPHQIWQVVLNPIQARNAAPPGCVGIFTDITEQQRAQEELYTSRALLQSLLNSIPDLLLVIDRDYRIVYQNNGALKPNDTTEESNCPICYQSFRSRHAPCEVCPVREVFATGKTVEQEQFHPENKRISEVRAFPIFTADGQVSMVIEYIRDITDRKVAEEALRTRQAKLDGIFRAAPVGIGLVVNRVIKEVNDQIGVMTGYAKEELLGQNSRLLYPSQAEYEMVGREKYLQIAQHGKGTVETRWRRRDGVIIDVMLSSAPLYPADLSGEILFTALDITERKRLEAARSKIDKMESLGIMAGGIAHDFNNVLMAILGNISLVGLASTPAEIRERLDDAEQGCRQAMLLAKQLLTFAKGGAPIKKPHDVKLLLEEAARLALSGSKSRKIMEFADGLRDVDVDDGQMYQVFTNLLINADQAMPSGGEIHIQGQNCTLREMDLPTLTPGKYVLITIADQGVGINPEHLDKIFDPYFSTKQKGSGLGLATVYSIVKQHGGLIACQANPGRGVTFSLYLPALEHSEKAETLIGTRIFLGKGRILVLEDDTTVRAVMARMLTKLGYEAVFAGEGQEVVDFYVRARQSRQSFDLVILDLTIPGGMGGFETFQKLQALDPDARAIVSSGYADDPILANFRELGFRGVICKPYRISHLSEVLHEAMG